MRAALMICGGTFDSQQEAEGGLGVDREFNPNRYDPLLKAVQDRIHEVELTLVHPPFRIDSSQLIPSQISDLVYAIQEVLCNFDDLVVAIGTDTLSYVVPGVATALGSIPNKCVAFVSGMNPWHMENSDALQNLIDALSLIGKRHYRGVMMVSGRQVYAPYNIAKISHDAIDPFREIKLHQRECYQQLSEVLQERLGRGISVGKPYDTEIITFSPLVTCKPLTRDNFIQSVVAQVQVFPGLETDSILRFVGDEIKHVIFRCYANGTAPISDAGPKFNLAEAVRKLSARGVMCYAVSQHLGAVAPGDYSVCREMKEAGCLYITHFTAETLHATLLVLTAILAEFSVVREHIRAAEE